MSGWAGIIHLDGSPVDRALVTQMTRLTERHGGDRFNVRGEQEFAFGHSLLASMPESKDERQPLSFDGDIWIVGDVRVDARMDLIKALERAGLAVTADRPDIELVLHAFHAWGKGCVDRMLGDFAFIVWSRSAKQVFAARDPFGIKPLYYSLRGSVLLCSNDIDALRVHPQVSSDLNEAAICDFLAFGYNVDEGSTCFSKIARLPPCHALEMDANLRVRFRRYTGLDVPAPIRYGALSDYCDHFLELFREAVSDRLRTDRVGFEFSGGMDSTSTAAMAAALNRENPEFAGKGITTDNSHRDPEDDEAQFAALAASHIGIEHQILPTAARKDLYTDCNTSQPHAWPFTATLRRFGGHMAKHGPVMLTGHGGDPYLHSSGYRVLDCYRESSLARFTASLLGIATKRRSLRGMGLSSLWNRDLPRIPMPPIPRWLRQDFVQRAKSVDRWKELFYASERYPSGCTNELARDELRMPMWSNLFENTYHDLFAPLDCRHPLYDRRLINFFFALPEPIKREKRLLRESMKGQLPEDILSRPKSGFSFDLIQPALADQSAAEDFQNVNRLEPGWVNVELWREDLDCYTRGEGGDLFTVANPLTLSKWIEAKL